MLEQLLDLDRLTLGGEGVRFAFERALPLYAWVGVGSACVAAGVAAYWRHSGARWLRWVLTGLRASLFLALAVLLAGPMLERRTESAEADWVLVLVDRSASMTVADAGVGDGRSTREGQLRAALASAGPAFERLGEGREVRWFGVGEGAYEFGAVEGQAPEIGQPLARRTRLGRGISDALQRAAARPLAGMLLISDGRSLDAAARSTLREFAEAGAPLHTVALGSTGSTTDVAVQRVAAPRVAYQNDPAPISVELVALGDDGVVRGRIDLIDERTGAVIESKDVELESGASEHRLAHRPSVAGEQRWRVEFVPDEADLVADNNSAFASIEIVDRPVRALYLDGYPRWEQRYLRNLLIREATVESANLMLAPGRRYQQEGDFEISTIPASPEEWSAYDVVVLGDLAPGVLTPAQIEQIRLFVAEDGGGLVWIGGESHTPRSWWPTALGALIPFTSPGGPVGVLDAPAQASPTSDAERLGVLQLIETRESAWPEELSDPSVGWSALHWVQSVPMSSLKPTTRLLATARPLDGGDDVPLVMTMRYGSGRVIYVASDEMWRWRYGRGEVLYERFWIQLVRLLARERLDRGSAGFRLRAASEAVSVGEPVPVTLEITDQSLLDASVDAVRVRIEPDEAGAGVELQLVRDAGGDGRFTAVWTPPSAGRWTMNVRDPALLGATGSDGAVNIDVTLPGDELADPRPDHDFLRELSEQTGGRTLTPDELSAVGDPGFFPSRKVRRVALEQETLWDTPLAIVLIILLGSLEWIGRRVLRVL